MTSQQTQQLPPDTPDPAALDANVYHTIVGPALRVAAEVAAKRGDPTLHADMPAMLALIDIITHFAHLYRQTHFDLGNDDSMLEGTPAAACVMVFREAEMDPYATRQCLGALEAAYKKLYEQDVISAARPFIAHAWEHLMDDQREPAHACLVMAANTIVTAIENWQSQVH